jgi:hypothetical protein
VSSAAITLCVASQRVFTVVVVVVYFVIDSVRKLLVTPLYKHLTLATETQKWTGWLAEQVIMFRVRLFCCRLSRKTKASY